ncbi:MAG: hypothetical protein AABY22_16910 [Nanoarchaeota archaeon]
MLEGVDKSGKSSLINYFSKLFPVQVWKFDRKPKDNSIEERLRIKNHYLTTLEMIKQLPNTIHVLDRFHFSELVYSIKRGYDAYEDSWFFDVLEPKIKELQHLLVLCNCEKKELSERFERESDKFVSIEEIDNLLKRYKLSYENSTLNHVQVDTTNRKFNENLSLIMTNYIHQNLGI